MFPRPDVRFSRSQATAFISLLFSIGGIFAAANRLILDNCSMANLWYRRGLKAGFSIADQAMLSGSNFTLNILLARWLESAEYGAFTLVFSIFLFLARMP